jgi:hypothetical protein
MERSRRFQNLFADVVDRPALQGKEIIAGHAMGCLKNLVSFDLLLSWKG